MEDVLNQPLVEHQSTTQELSEGNMEIQDCSRSHILNSISQNLKILKESLFDLKIELKNNRNDREIFEREVTRQLTEIQESNAIIISRFKEMIINMNETAEAWRNWRHRASYVDSGL